MEQKQVRASAVRHGNRKLYLLLRRLEHRKQRAEQDENYFGYTVAHLQHLCKTAPARFPFPALFQSIFPLKLLGFKKLCSIFTPRNTIYGPVFWQTIAGTRNTRLPEQHLFIFLKKKR
jgi:hypothetical protein